MFFKLNSISNLIKVLAGGGAAAAVFGVILAGMATSTNIYTGTVRTIAAAAGISEWSAKKGVQRLIELGILRRVKNGQYMVNPRDLAMGNDGKYRKLCDAFDQLKVKSRPKK